MSRSAALVDQQVAVPAVPEQRSAMLERFGVAVSPGGIKIENVAAVLVTAEIGPYAQSGARLDVTASSIGDARSLQGGTLLPTKASGHTYNVEIDTQPVSWDNVELRVFSTGRAPVSGLFTKPDSDLQTLSLTPRAGGFALREDPQAGKVTWDIRVRPLAR